MQRGVVRSRELFTVIFGGHNGLWNRWSYGSQLLYTGRLCQGSEQGHKLERAWSWSHDHWWRHRWVKGVSWAPSVIGVRQGSVCDRLSIIRDKSQDEEESEWRLITWLFWLCGADVSVPRWAHFLTKKDQNAGFWPQIFKFYVMLSRNTAVGGDHPSRTMSCSCPCILTPSMFDSAASARDPCYR